MTKYEFTYKVGDLIQISYNNNTYSDFAKMIKVNKKSFIIKEIQFDIDHIERLSDNVNQIYYNHNYQEYDNLVKKIPRRKYHILKIEDHNTICRPVLNDDINFDKKYIGMSLDEFNTIKKITKQKYRMSNSIFDKYF